jgi:outer membrane protein
VKKVLLILAALIIGSNFIFAQAQIKIGYVDSQAILSQYSEAIKAQGDLDALTARWSAQIDSMTMDLQRQYQDYQKQAANMPEDRRMQIQQELVKQEQDIIEFRNQKFGQRAGEIYQRQEEIFEPVRKKIYLAIEQTAKEEGMQFVFDKANDLLLLYADTAFEITFKVLDKLKRG